MFPDNKIRNKDDIRHLFTSRSVSVKGAKLFYREHSRDISRVLVTPGKKYGNAVERNYIKRVARSIVRDIFPQLRTGYDIALVFYSGTYTYMERYNQILMLFQKTPILF
ncbi:MAG: ribonuclease P protein component [Salinispira sp.]